ncbi:MAG: rubredoxin [Deltaproteobacteria bacterium]|nr:rubredoxin [Deltaproteobacteria bacterium]MCB9479524.1 rubredoxin [Deltaproteobacteria bacterium]MCB9488446.1 rubredoxin [Deltaproteobacteria bacterium]
MEQAGPPRWTGKFKCLKCSYIYDPKVGCPEQGVPPGTAFEDLPEGFRCPQCGVDLTQFERLEKWKKRHYMP